MAQLGDLLRAKALVRRAAQAFGAKEALARARCVVVEAEIALASRELGWPVKALDAARVALMSHGDSINAAHARYLQIRRLLLIGQLDEAQALLADLDPASCLQRCGPPMNWWWRGLRCGACNPKRHGRRSSGPNSPRASPALRRCAL